MTGVTKLWSDEPATIDLLSFDAIAETVTDALFDQDLDPIALGLSGAWGSGKTTVLNLIDSHVKSRSTNDKKVVIVRADPWRYDPNVGTKESLINEVLKQLSSAFEGDEAIKHGAIDALKKLAKRVNWSKAIKMTARTALTAQLPSIDDVMGLVSDEPESLDKDKGMDEFRTEFANLLANPALNHVSQVVVLVDDLDRCLPETVVETLEAIRLFLSTEGMSFVIAADETRVAEAIQRRLQSPDGSGPESPASLYLHKIVQTTIPVPALSYFDTRSYLFLLLSRGMVPADVYEKLVDDCANLRSSSGSLDDLTMPTGHDLSLQMATASRLTPILYEKFQGNPRRIKRFMNDLNVRQSIATRRGITLEPDAIAKLMVIEKLLKADFDELLKWLASGVLREKLDALKVETQGQPAPGDTEDEAPEAGDDSKRARAAGDFSGTMVRWAKLPPELDATDVSGYLTLAAAFQGRLLVDESLPEKLRDLAAALTSSSQIDRSAVKDEELKNLPPGDVVELLSHLGRRMQDDPSIQLPTVNAIVTIAGLHKANIAEAKNALGRLPGQEVKASTVLVLQGKVAEFEDVLQTWKASAGDTAVRAIATVRGEKI